MGSALNRTRDHPRGPRRPTQHAAVAAVVLVAMLSVGCGGVGAGPDDAPAADPGSALPDTPPGDDQTDTTDAEELPAAQDPPRDGVAHDEPRTGTDGNDRPGAAPTAPLEGRHRIHLDGRLVEVSVTDGRGQLPDDRRLVLDGRLVARGDLTGDGRDEVVIAGSVLPAAADQPRIPVLSVRADVGPLDPPEVDLPDIDFEVADTVTWVRGPVSDGQLTALGVHEGGIDARVEARLRGADPPPDRPRYPYEQRWVRRDGQWQGSNDGPVTRAARDALEDSEVFWTPGDTILCGEVPGPRGTTATCAELTTDGPARVALLFVDDAFGYRVTVARDALLTGEEIATVLGDQARCADVRQLAEAGLPGAVVPFAAIAYWFQQGQPARMDASGEGRPCATVWPDAVELLHGGVDGRIVDSYQASLG